MQIFAKKGGVLAGIAEVLRMLEAALSLSDQARVEVTTRCDGDTVTPWEPVMQLRGPYGTLAALETPLIGILARRTLVASNTRLAVMAAAGRPVTFMAPRHDDWRVQAGDGWAALLGGASAVSSDMAGSWAGQRGVGTMPHALIAAFAGDTVAATLALASWARAQSEPIPVVSLVDYDNDVCATAVAVANAMTETFGPGSLAAVRVDTSEKLVDTCLAAVRPDAVDHPLHGVNPLLVQKLRTALDAEGFSDVGILVSGGFTPGKIASFVSRGVPVDGFGVGSSLLGHNAGDDGLVTGFDFTADLVEVDGNPQHKIGRPMRPVTDAVCGTVEALLNVSTDVSY